MQEGEMDKSNYEARLDLRDLLGTLTILHDCIEMELQQVVLAVSDLIAADNLIATPTAGLQLRHILARGGDRIRSALGRQRVLLWEFAVQSNPEVAHEDWEKDKQSPKCSRQSKMASPVGEIHDHQRCPSHKQQRKKRSGVQQSTASSCRLHLEKTSESNRSEEKLNEEIDWKRDTLVRMHFLLQRKAVDQNASEADRAASRRDMAKIKAAMADIMKARQDDHGQLLQQNNETSTTRATTTIAAAAAATVVGGGAFGCGALGPKPLVETARALVMLPENEVGDERINRNDSDASRGTKGSTQVPTKVRLRPDETSKKEVPGSACPPSLTCSRWYSWGNERREEVHKRGCSAEPLRREIGLPDGLGLLLRRISEGVHPSRQHSESPASEAPQLSPSTQGREIKTETANTNWELPRLHPSCISEEEFGGQGALKMPPSALRPVNENNRCRGRCEGNTSDSRGVTTASGKDYPNEQERHGNLDDAVNDEGETKQKEKVAECFLSGVEKEAAERLHPQRQQEQKTASTTTAAAVPPGAASGRAAERTASRALRAVSAGPEDNRNPIPGSIASRATSGDQKIAPIRTIGLSKGMENYDKENRQRLPGIHPG